MTPWRPCGGSSLASAMVGVLGPLWREPPHPAAQVTGVARTSPGAPVALFHPWNQHSSPSSAAFSGRDEASWTHGEIFSYVNKRRFGKCGGWNCLCLPWGWMQLRWTRAFVLWSQYLGLYGPQPLWTVQPCL